MTCDEDTGQQDPDGILKQHPRLAIFLIAGVFYLILCSMLIVVLVLFVNRA